MQSKVSKRDFVKVDIGPVQLEEGIIGRVVELPDGSGRVETWDGTNWRHGGAALHEFVRSSTPSRATLMALGVPEEECEGALD